ncbi:hypothetical protein NQK81_01250 [Amycolatopsis roodepoortensis]|uniref:hypothetical protein n=1 Tax=Amycolatopsis roodepoortensis TaxID=700274 RepID=UPI00214BBDD5|nr:hypothetical protein [Amycolatopsis roodepoortensis]UUV32101.1 hypothetical protein NQK81_01250 [Amycolatopsis roodepoortensis]
MTNDIDLLKAQIAAHHAADAEFRRRVRQLATRQWLDGDWCVAGIQYVLTELDLPPMTLAVEGEVLIRVRIDGVNGVADDEEAQARVAAALSVTCTDPGITWSVDLVEPYLTAEPVGD